jgi:hypothetical protein
MDSREGILESIKPNPGQADGRFSPSIEAHTA